METIVTEIGGNPFEITLNTSLENNIPVEGYDCLWTLGLAYQHLDEQDMPTIEEREEMVTLSNLALSMIRLEADIVLVGTTNYQGTQEILFYTKSEDVQNVGGVINEFPESIGDAYAQRQLGVQAVEDNNWDQVLGYFELLQAAREEQFNLN